MQQFLVTFNLDPPLEGPCADQALKDMEAKLPSILNTTNWLICLNLLCVPAEQTWVYSINMLQPSEEVNESLYFHLRPVLSPVTFYQVLAIT